MKGNSIGAKLGYWLVRLCLVSVIFAAPTYLVLAKFAPAWQVSEPSAVRAR